MVVANKTIKINDEKYEAVIYSDKNNLYMWLFQNGKILKIHLLHPAIHLHNHMSIA